ncbi:tyrosine-type recombinase/integrase [Shimia ponticola]|uniref:tyrosine-type recombinase/integrase n=1 Tax=Shimia ponticola TaxID=2582893 RepID=UPI0011BD5310|nr:site-specific integrase [Shimia ponticola]
MTKRANEKNERLKRQFMEYRKYARQLSDKTLDRELAALEWFDVWNGRKDFIKFQRDWAMGFRDHLERAKTTKGQPLGKSSARAIMATLREFTLWLSQQDGFRSKVKAADAEYFNLSRRDEAEARAAPARPAPSVKQAKRALESMPANTPREMRDKALFALLCLTGIRVSALISLRIKHVDLADKSVTQPPPARWRRSSGNPCTPSLQKSSQRPKRRYVHGAPTSKTLFFGPADPLFPTTALTASAAHEFEADGFERRAWKSTEPARKIVNAAFTAVSLPTFGPHAVRHMLARDAAKNCKSIAEIVATSQNLGHTDVLTTLRNYGQLDRDRMRQLITGESEAGVLED